MLSLPEMLTLKYYSSFIYSILVDFSTSHQILPEKTPKMVHSFKRDCARLPSSSATTWRRSVEAWDLQDR